MRVRPEQLLILSGVMKPPEQVFYYIEPRRTLVVSAHRRPRRSPGRCRSIDFPFLVLFSDENRSAADSGQAHSRRPTVSTPGRHGEPIRKWRNISRAKAGHRARPTSSTVVNQNGANGISESQMASAAEMGHHGHHHHHHHDAPTSNASSSNLRQSQTPGAQDLTTTTTERVPEIRLPPFSVTAV